MTGRRGVLLGAGGIARSAHLPAYHLGDRLRIVAAVDAMDPLPALDGIPVFRSLGEALEREAVEFADICTPTAAHHAGAMEALEHGLHVFCEKPVAITAGDAAELDRAARRARRVLFPCHQYRQNPAWRALRRAIDDGAIGRWHLAEFHVYRLEADRGTAAAGVPWRGRRESALGGVLLDHGTHLLYLMLDVAGLPAGITAHLSRLGHRAYDVEDTAHALFDYGDRVVTVTLTWAGRARENRIRFIGDEGMIEWTGGLLRLTRHDGSTDVTDFSAQLDKREYAGWMGRTLEDFADAVDAGGSDAALTEISAVATLLEGCYRSAADGRRVALR